MKRALLTALLAASMAVGVREANAEIVERIVAKVNGDIITLTEWQDAVEVARAGGQSVPAGGENDKFTEQVLDRMVTDRLIIQAGLADGLKATDSEVAAHVDREIEAVRSRFASQKEFVAQLKREGITLADLRLRYQEQIKERFIYLKMVARKQRELEAACDVSEEEVAAYYETNRDKNEWKTPPRIRARHIQFSVPPEVAGEARQQAFAKARELSAAARSALNRGEDFAEVAMTFSDDATTKAEGGDLGVFAKGTYHESLEKAAFALKKGEISGLVESPVGLHLIQLVEKLPELPMKLDDTLTVPATPAAPTPQVMMLRDFIKAQIRNERLSERFQEWVQNLRGRALIQLFTVESASQDAAG